MSLFERFFKEEQKPDAPISGDTPAEPVEAASVQTTAKVKLNFKRLPKKLVQAIADETTGQTIVRESDQPPPRSRGMGGLTDAFNAAVRGTDSRDGNDNDVFRSRPAPPAAPMRPRMPSLSP